ncbi:MAG TPA: hypothetical protein VFQ65_14400, partial [Kofleriaceae bacterium]|nr:hypothetical protein [Kofleriaceae bacterium]
MVKAWPLLLVTTAISGVAAAEPRSFTHTFEYATLASGDSEVELWHREVIHDAGAARETLDDELQVGFGAADHVEADVIAAVTDDGVAMHFAALRGELRGRIADRGELPVDVAIHAGAAKEFDERVYDAYARLVLARDFDRITVAATGQVLFRFGADSVAAKRQYDGAAGITYELAPRFHAGLEAWGTLDTDSNHVRSYELGPAL